MGIKPKKILIIGYFLILLTALILYIHEIIPFPYNKAPLGLILGLLTATMSIGPFILLGTSSRSGLKRWDIAMTAGMGLVIAFILKWIPFNFDTFHITTNISRVSLFAGFILAAAFFLSYKHLAFKERQR